VAGEDGWWRRIFSSLSADFFNGKFLLAIIVGIIFFARGQIYEKNNDGLSVINCEQ
jgi:hypothetical protein